MNWDLYLVSIPLRTFKTGCPIINLSKAIWIEKWLKICLRNWTRLPLSLGPSLSVSEVMCPYTCVWLGIMAWKNKLILLILTASEYFCSDRTQIFSLSDYSIACVRLFQWRSNAVSAPLSPVSSWTCWSPSSRRPGTQTCSWGRRWRWK